MANLIIVCGLPGVGKTTVARGIITKIEAVLLRTDVIRQELRSLEYSEKERQRTYSEMFFRAKKLLKNDRNVILDATFAKRNSRQIAEKIAQDSGASFKIVEVICPESIVKKRMKKRKGDESRAEFKHYLEHKKIFQPIKKKHIIVDTSQYEEEEITRIIEGCLR